MRDCSLALSLQLARKRAEERPTTLSGSISAPALEQMIALPQRQPTKIRDFWIWGLQVMSLLCRASQPEGGEDPKSRNPEMAPIPVKSLYTANFSDLKIKIGGARVISSSRNAPGGVWTGTRPRLSAALTREVTRPSRRTRKQRAKHRCFPLGLGKVVIDVETVTRTLEAGGCGRVYYFPPPGT